MDLSNICIIFVGESFRLGGQSSRNTGSEQSVNEQVEALNSHCHFMQFFKEKYKDSTINIYVQTYSTRYDDLIKQIYDGSVANNKCYNIVSEDNKHLYNDLNDSMNEILSIISIDSYDMIYIIRIDLILKPFFTQLMLSKNINKLTFTSILFKHNNIHLYVFEDN